MIAAAVARYGPRLRRYARAFTYAGRDQIAYPFALLTRGLMLIVFGSEQGPDGSRRGRR